jgi:hypothetical protein
MRDSQPRKLNKSQIDISRNNNNNNFSNDKISSNSYMNAKRNSALAEYSDLTKLMNTSGPVKSNLLHSK